MREQSNVTTLSNGIRVVTDKLENFESVVLGYWVEAGGVCESESECGISHFLEHMAFKGTKTRTAAQIAEEIEAVGGYSNAYTSKEVTAFHAKVLKKDTPIAIDILSDILLNPTFETEELERERGVILQEISQTFDTPDDIIFDYFQNMAFKDQSMGRSILGPSSIVSKISADDLRRYRARYYNADNVVFAAVGNVDHEEIVESANRYFSQFSDVATPEHDEVYKYIGGTYSDKRSLEQAHLIIGFNGVSSLSDNYYTMAVFSSILGGGMSSRLFQEVREKRGLVYSIYASSSSYKHNGTFGVYAATSADKLPELSKVVSDELVKMRGKISEQEFDRTKAQFRASLLMSYESNASVCDRIVNQTLLFGHPLSHEDMLKNIDSVTIEDVQKLTDIVLASKTSVVTVGNCDYEQVIPALQTNGIKVDE